MRGNGDSIRRPSAQPTYSEHMEQDAVTALARELIGIDSVNPGLVNEAAGEAAIAHHLADRLGRAGLDVELVEAAGDRGRTSVLAVWTATETREHQRTVVLNGHLDTVGVEGMAHPFASHIEGDRLVGRGASDMKGGVAGIVVAAEALVRRGSPGRIVVALVADEEDASLGAEAVIDRLAQRGIRPDVCLIAEPTWLDLASEHRGFALYRVTLEGRAAHSSQPELGVDVVRPLNHVLSAIATQDASLRADSTRDLHGSLMTTVVRAGSAPFTVAAHAELLVERRTLPGEARDVGLAELEDILGALSRETPDVTASVELVVARNAWESDADGRAAELAQLLRDELSRAGRAPGDLAAPYWMESALWQEAGVPTVVCGPAGGGLHAVDEWLDLTQLRDFTAAVEDAVAAFLRAPD